MFDMVKNWYQRRFSDPHAVSLVAILAVGFIVIYFCGHLLAPLLVAIVLAYLLEWPVQQLMKFNLPRFLSVMIVVSAFIGLLMVGFFFIVPTV
ncbi:MAG: AI-2E family transporter, partial [Vibrio sp.]